MGKARIISGGPTGRYTIEMDYGSAIKTAAVAALATVSARVDADTLAAQVLVDDADAKETAQRLVIADVENILIDSMQSGTPAGSPELADVNKLFQFEVYQLKQLQQAHIILRLRLQALKAEKTVVNQRVAYWNNFEPLETRDAWCVDLTEDGAAEAQVGTIDIPGESNLLLIAPGCRAPIASDGALQAREVMSPAQAYFNAAILPGWQKFQPTYRWGTITDIDYDADTANVTIASAISSAQSLNVNQGTALVAVPVEYLDCNAAAFEVGDRCVVKFAGQDWDAPTVIGFLDNPKPCVTWPRVEVRFNTSGSFVAGSGSRAWLQPVVSIECGPGVVQTSMPIEDQVNDMELVFTDAQFYDAPGEPEVPSGMVIESAVMPAPMPLGDFNMSIVSASTLANPLPFLSVPTGSSPALLLWLQKTGLNVAFKSVSRPFTTTTDNEWAFTEDPPTCMPTSRTAPQFDGHVVDDALVTWSETTIYGPGPISTIPTALPAIIVAYDGRRRNYVLDGAAEIPLGSGWRFVFRAGPWIEA